MSDAKRKPHEAVRNTLDLFRSMLASLSVAHRAEVLAAISPDADAWRETVEWLNDQLQISTREQLRLMKELDEWKIHNEQRLEEVYAARELLGAQPDETLPVAVARVKKTVIKKCWCGDPMCTQPEPWPTTSGKHST